MGFWKIIWEKLLAFLKGFEPKDPQLSETPHGPLADEIPPLPVVSEPKKDTLTIFARAQQAFEGWGAPGAIIGGVPYPNGTPSWRRKNPGNIKKKDGSFYEFSTEDEGFDFLKEYIARVARGEHRAYPRGGDTTIYEYTHIYTGDPEPSPTNYAKKIAGDLGVSVFTPLKDLGLV